MSNTPRMLTIREAAAETGLSEHFIRQLCKTGQIVCVQAGTKYLVNLDRFIEYLNGGHPTPAADAEHGKIRRVG